MSSYRNTFRVVLLSVFIGVNILILFGIGQLLSYLNTGADRTTMLHTTLPTAKKYLPKVIWKDTTNPGRPIEKQTLSKIESDYLQAWYVKNVAYQTNDSFGINDFFTQNAKRNILNHVQDQTAKNIVIEATSLCHQLSLDFYSLDGQLAVLSDKNNEQYQRIYQKGKLITENYVKANYQIVMLLEDGFWKIRHLVKQPVVKQQESLKPHSDVEENKILVDGQPYRIKGINYYPQLSAWNMFGVDFNAKIITEDFKKIKKMQFNTVRIFVGYEDFGGAEVIPDKLEKLKRVLDIAQENELKVIVTLFDFYGNYEVLDWTLTHRHAEQVVTALKDHEALLAWDVKNEPDLDFDTRNKSTVLAWLKEIIVQVKKYDPSHLVTIGWSDAKSASLLKNSVHIISFHYYGKISDFENSYLKLKSNTNKPIVLQEFGLPSSNGFWSPLGASEQDQADYYVDFKAILNKNNIHYLPWTLYDFKNIPTSVVGILPWRKHQQKYFGFIDINGKPKKSFRVFKSLK